MSLVEFLNDSRPMPVVEHSVVESDRAGIRIGRLTCGVNTDWAAFDPETAIRDSDVDLVIMRFDAAQVQVPQQLVDVGLRTWHADTLIYFGLNVANVPQPDPATSFARTTGEEPELAEIIAAAFAGYRNHYSASKELRHIDVASAYADWTLRQARTPNSGCFGLSDEQGALIGFAVVDARHPGFNEWTLSGVHPRARGRGYYSQIIRHVARLTGEAGKSEVVTSTQASNVPSMRGFCREGFLPTLSLNTLHITKSPVSRRVEAS